jgi:hypothetical protein
MARRDPPVQIVEKVGLSSRRPSWVIVILVPFCHQGRASASMRHLTHSQLCPFSGLSPMCASKARAFRRNTPHFNWSITLYKCIFEIVRAYSRLVAAGDAFEFRGVSTCSNWPPPHRRKPDSPRTPRCRVGDVARAHHAF